MKYFLSFLIIGIYGIHSLAAEEASESENSYSLTFTAGPFYDGNVSQSIGHSGDGGATVTAPPGALPPPPGQSRPSSAVYSDSGLIGNLGYQPDLFLLGKNQISLTSEIDTTSYQTYRAYNTESLKFGPSLKNAEGSSEYVTSLYYSSTYYQGVYSQDYLHFDHSLSWTAGKPQISVSFEFTQYLGYHPNQWTLSVPLAANWVDDSTTWTLSFTPAFGGGMATTYAFSGPTLTALGGDEFSRYSGWTASAKVQQKWGSKWSASFEVANAQTNYQLENTPATSNPGVLTGARIDQSSTGTLTVKYQIKPDKLSCEFSSMYVSNISSGYQGLSSGPNSSGPPTYTYNRPYTYLNLIYEM